METLTKHFDEVINSDNCERWKGAMRNEIETLTENNTYTLLPPSNNKNVIPSRWIFTKKIKACGKKAYKARFVARRFSQIYGVDCSDTFSPTSFTTRILLQLATQYGLTIHQMDVKNAYLYTPIDCEIYIKPPEGFKMESENLVWKLKSLYGLKQSGINWNQTLHSYLIKQNFKQCPVDAFMYNKIVNY